MTTHYEDSAVTLLHGDCIEILKTLPDSSVDSVVCDPPYGLEFMGKDWDRFAPQRDPRTAGRAGEGSQTNGGGFGQYAPSFGMQKPTTWRCNRCDKRDQFRNHSPKVPDCDGEWQKEPIYPGAPKSMLAFQQWCEEWTAECLRVLKPGGHLLAFGGTRTWHRLACAVEDAGFEVRDSIAWLYGSGFAKGGLLGNRPGLSWCECGENPLPYNHADNTDLPRVRDDIHPPAIARSKGDDGLLFPEVQRSGQGSGLGKARTQGPSGLVAGSGSVSRGENDRSAEPSMGGRHLPRAGEGLPDDSEAGASEGSVERLRGRAPAGHGSADRASGAAAGGGSSHQRRQGGQPAGEPEALPGPHEPLDDGALRGRAECARCGGYDPAFRGFSTALKPAFEPVVVARKPLVGTVAANVLTYGTGALNIDATRIETDWATDPTRRGWQGGNSREGYEPPTVPFGSKGERVSKPSTSGRWPANVILDDTQAASLDLATLGKVGSNSGQVHGSDGQVRRGGIFGEGVTDGDRYPTYEQRGEFGASRFFYVAKAGKKERPNVDGTAHPTVKPLTLMRWLVRLVTPPGGTVLEPFAGSGTTVEACLLEGFRCIAIEKTDEYLPLILARIERANTARLADEVTRTTDPETAILEQLDDGMLNFEEDIA